MLTEEEYMRKSIELHLFFARILKEHGTIIYTTMLENNPNKPIARKFRDYFSNILREVIEIADNRISEEWKNSGSFVTEYTFNIETLTEKLGDLKIDKELTKRTLALKSGNLPISQSIMDKIEIIHKKALEGIESGAKIVTDIFKEMTNNQSFLYNYPQLVAHYLAESNIYKAEIERLQNREKDDPTYIYNTEYRLNIIMQQHGKFIRGMTNTAEDDIIAKAEEFIREYNNILEKYTALTPDVLDNITLKNISTTEEFKQFKTYLTQRLLNSNLYMVIMPLFIDHVLREASYFIRKLKDFRLEK